MGTSSIDERVQHERDGFEDVGLQHGRLRRRFAHVWESPNTARSEATFAQLADRVMPGADVLDVGCGDGRVARGYLSRNPKKVTGIDLIPGWDPSEPMPPQLSYQAMDAHNTSFTPESFDVVCGRAILHHLDFTVAINEVHRLLRPGGYAIFTEPLRDNPVGKLIRAMTPRARTQDELPLSRRQILWADSRFSGNAHQFFGLASAGLGLLTSLTPLPADNALLRLADRMDQAIARTPLKYWMRFALLVWRK